MTTDPRDRLRKLAEWADAEARRILKGMYAASAHLCDEKDANLRALARLARAVADAKAVTAWCRAHESETDACGCTLIDRTLLRAVEEP